MRILVALAFAVFLASFAADAVAQEASVRFEITQVGDSTFQFPVRRHDWVGSSQQGIVVDPRRRDILVARFRILRVRGGVATALVTGQTTSLMNWHVALLERPQPPWYRQRAFWTGVFMGGVIGVAAGSQF